MAAINFKDLFAELEANVLALAKASFKSVTLLAQGTLTPDDFELLVTAQKDLVEMTALQKAGLTIIKAEQFRDSIVNLITDTVFSAIPGL